MSSLNLTSAVSVFPCPRCRETINTSVAQCPFCATPIDHAAAATSAVETSRISAACSDVSYLKTTAWAILAFSITLFVPFVGLLGTAGFMAGL